MKISKEKLAVLEAHAKAIEKAAKASEGEVLIRYNFSTISTKG